MSIDKKKISKYAIEIINKYKYLEVVEGTKINCPYYRDVKKIGKNKLRSLSGKGTPQEIIDELRIAAHMCGFDLLLVSKQNIKTFMEKKGIGIDCSGFVLWVCYYWLKKEYHINLFKVIRKNKNKLLKKIRLLFRAPQNIDVLDLTDKKIVDNIKDINDIEPGDFLRMGDNKGRIGFYHIAMVTEVEKVNEKVKKIWYYHSSEYYGNRNGVKKGEIEIINTSEGLEKQLWKEIDGEAKEKNKCWTKNGYLNNHDGKNGFYRLKILKYC